MNFILNEEYEETKCIQEFKLWWSVNSNRLNDNIMISADNMLFNSSKNDADDPKLETLDFNIQNFEEIEDSIKNKKIP